jgi:hypothetical protein
MAPGIRYRRLKAHPFSSLRMARFMEAGQAANAICGLKMTSGYGFFAKAEAHFAKLY